MTAFAYLKVLCSVISLVAGTLWISQRMVPVTSEGSDEVLHQIKGWDAVTTGIAALVLGIALMLDALGVVVWIGEW